MNRHLAAFALATLALASGAHAETAGTGECRRFVPTVGVTVNVPCIENAALKTPTGKTETVTKPAPAAPAPAPAAAAVASPAAVSPAPLAKPVGRPSADMMKRCVEILDRAQFGRSLPGDAALLRDSCRTAG
jgi:cell division septation protein DedD